MATVARLAIAAGVVSVAHANKCNSTLVKGKVPVDGDSDFFLAGEGGSVSSGGELTVKHWAGFTGFSKCAADWEPESFHSFKVLGKRVAFEVDLSRVGCACNLAFYLIGAPAKSYDGKFDKGSDRQGQPPYYCDANMVGGQWCPEMDIMEANNHVFQATAHSCDKPVNGHYFFCDRSGCDESTKNYEHSYGPGNNYTIDTRKAFTVYTDFLEGDGKFTGMVTTLAQGHKKVVMDHGKCKLEYLDKLSDVLRDGMSLRITYWGGDAQTMAWMDKEVCSSDLSCKGDNAGDAVISKIGVSEVPKSVYEEQAKRAEKAKAAATTPVPWWSKQQEHGQQQGQEQEHQQQQPTPAPVWTEQWVSDIYQPWQCHVYENPKQEMAKWCVTAGFQDGFEFSYNGGVGSPCGECFCCKRKAKKAWAQQTTPIPATNELIWVVVDPEDDRFGQRVPHHLTADGSHFVHLGRQGVAQWEDKFRYVKMMTQVEKDNLKNGGVALDHIIMQKYVAGVGSSDTDMVGWQRWLTVSGVPGCLLLALAVLGVVGFGFRRYRRGSAPCTPPSTPRGGGRQAVPMTPASSAGLMSPTDASPGVGMGITGPSPMRRNRSGTQMLLSRSTSGSSQNLLWNASRGFSDSQTSLAGMA